MAGGEAVDHDTDVGLLQFLFVQMDLGVADRCLSFGEAATLLDRFESRAFWGEGYMVLCQKL